MIIARSLAVVMVVGGLICGLPTYTMGQDTSGAYFYDIEITGVEDEGLRTLLGQVSRLVELGEKPPATGVALERRIDGDVARLTEALRSEGYYDATIAPTVNSDVTPTKIVLAVIPGPRTALGAFTVAYLDVPSGGVTLPQPETDLGYTAGAPAKAITVTDLERRLLAVLAEKSCPLATVMQRKALVDHAEHVMTVTLEVNPGPRVTFGAVLIKGLERVEEDHVRLRVPFAIGAPYRQSEVEILRERLTETKLFGTVTVESARKPAADGSLPITVTVTERPSRSIGGGIKYSTSEGPGGQVFWEHRNLFGRQESVRVAGIASPLRRAVTVDGRTPDVGQLDQDLTAVLEVRRQSTPAFTESGFASTLALERKLSKVWRVSGGVSAEYLRSLDHFGDHIAKLAGLPVVASYDSTDSPLDPSGGTRLSLASTPYVGGSGPAEFFLHSEAKASTYLLLPQTRHTVFALRGRGGSVVGTTTASLPAVRRFYSGGGGSDRGYGYQLVGPIDGEGRPIGGRAVLEAGVELRFRFTDEFGVAPFVEGGHVAEGGRPGFEQGLRWGSGIGFTYFTPVGPARLDVAFPLDRRPGVDRAFQIYFTFGQSF